MNFTQDSSRRRNPAGVQNNSVMGGRAITMRAVGAYGRGSAAKAVMGGGMIATRAVAAHVRGSAAGKTDTLVR